MKIRMSIGWLALLGLLCLIGPTVQGQTYPASCLAHPSCAVYSPSSGCQPILPPGSFDCVNTGPFSAQCSLKTYQCGDPPPCLTCCIACAGRPIDLSNGNTFISENDLSVPGLGGGLTLTRTWNSLSTAVNGLFGLGWRSTYEESVSVSNGYVAYARADGGIVTFGYASGVPGSPNSSLYVAMAPANSGDSLVFDGTNWTLTRRSGETRSFSGTTGNLSSISDRNGNLTALTYDASNRLVTVTDAAFRHLYLSYSGSGSLVTGVTSDIGVAMSYQYDSLSRLVQVTKPDSTTLSFQYDLGSRITAVLDSQGKVLESHTYDALGRGLSSSEALGVGALIVSYQ